MKRIGNLFLKKHSSIIALISSVFAPIGGIAQTLPIAQNRTANTSQSVPTDPFVHYRSYNAALDNGDIELAYQEGQKAWRAAEAKWGNSNANTSVLAYNAAWSAMFANQPSSAIEPARRAKEIAAINNGAYSVENADFLVSYAEFLNSKAQDKMQFAQILAEKAKKIAPSWDDFIAIRALNDSAYALLTSDKANEAIELSDLALATLSRLQLDMSDLKAKSLLNKGIANIILKKYQQAILELIDARIAYGPPRSKVDYTWGSLTAWHAAANALAESNDIRAQRKDKKTDILLPVRNREYRILSDAEEEIFRPWSKTCKKYEINRNQYIGRDIIFPRNQLNEFRVGGVVVIFDISASGEVENPVLIGSVPQNDFGQSAVRAISSWRYNFDPNTPETCRIGYVMKVTFVIGS